MTPKGFFLGATFGFALLTCFEAAIGDKQAALTAALATFLSAGFYTLHRELEGR